MYRTDKQGLILQEKWFNERVEMRNLLRNNEQGDKEKENTLIDDNIFKRLC